MVIGPFGFFQSVMKEARPSSAFTVPGPLPTAKAPIGATAMATIASAAMPCCLATAGTSCDSSPTSV